MDLKKVKIFKVVTKKFKKFLNSVTFIGQNFYPELLNTMLIINAPFIFKGFWTVIKVWLDKETQKKIFIYSGSAKKEIAKYCDMNYVPVFLGGNC